MTELAAGQRVAPLKIRAIETVPVLAPLGRVYRGSFYHMTHRATVVTRVITEEGIVGEAYAGDEDKTLHEIDAIIRDEIAPRLVGLDAFATERCHEAAWPSTFDILRDRRLGLVAVACVDTAIWDAVGKALGPAAVAPLGRLPRPAADGHHRRLLRRSRAGPVRRGDRRATARWGSPAASSRSAA